jgi:tetratricopeptide (TPR) repeat protein
MLMSMSRTGLSHLFVIALLATPAGAQVAAPDLPQAGAPAAEDAAGQLETLLQALADEGAAEPARLSQRIAELWSKSGSDSVDYLLGRGRAAIEAEELDKAVEHLTALVGIEPGFAEGWNARATAHFLRDDYWAAVADIQKVLEIEPRHYGALAGLAVMLERIGAEGSALAAHRAALAVNPHLEGAKEAVKRLAPTVDGRDI